MNFVYAIPLQNDWMITHGFRDRNLTRESVNQNQERALPSKVQKLLSSKNNVAHAQHE